MLPVILGDGAGGPSFQSTSHFDILCYIENGEPERAEYLFQSTSHFDILCYQGV